MICKKYPSFYAEEKMKKREKLSEYNSFKDKKDVVFLIVTLKQFLEPTIVNLKFIRKGSLYSYATAP